MKLGIWTVLAWLGFEVLGQGQTRENANPARVDEAATELFADSYVVIGATPTQEALLRAQIRVMQPEVFPVRIIFVPHWKYVNNARILRLHVPTGYTSAMFTHLPSRTIFIDNNRYLGEEWLGHWIAHELGHLATNSVREDDAEKAASKYRKKLKNTRRESERSSRTSHR